MSVGKSRDPSVRFVFEEEAIRKVRRLTQSGSRTEAGGILLGEFIPSELLVRVRFASKPGRQDRRARFSFERDGGRATRIASRAWRLSGGVLHYVGEWHTHPEPHPSPSWKDRNSMRKQMRESTVVAGTLVLLIVGTRGDWVGVWDARGHRALPNGLEIG